MPTGSRSSRTPRRLDPRLRPAGAKVLRRPFEGLPPDPEPLDKHGRALFGQAMFAGEVVDDTPSDLRHLAIAHARWEVAEASILMPHDDESGITMRVEIVGHAIK